jgi:hypothetical protein
MSYGYSRSTRFRKMKSQLAPVPEPERGKFHKHEESKMPVTVEQRIAKSIASVIKGEITPTEAVLEQQEIASSLFPLAKSVGEALSQYGETYFGKHHIAALAKLEHLKMQHAARIGDGDLRVSKGDVVEIKSASPHVHRASKDNNEARAKLAAYADSVATAHSHGVDQAQDYPDQVTNGR